MTTTTSTAVAHGEFIAGTETARIIKDDLTYIVQIRLENGCWDASYMTRSLRNAERAYAQRFTG